MGSLKTSIEKSFRKKEPATGKVVSYARNCLNTQLQRKKSILTTKPTYVTRLDVGAV